MKQVARINISPVKGFRLLHPEQIELGADGVAENRRFFLVGRDGQRLRSSLTAWLSLLASEYDAAAERLRITLPDGTELEGDARGNGESVSSTSGTLPMTGRVVAGAWNDAISDYAGEALCIARSDTPGLGQHAPLTFVSDGSLARLAEQAGLAEVDPRRFRMLFELAGCAAHEEDEWDGRRFGLGSAVVRVGGPVDRCAVTMRDPDTAERDLETLRLIKAYRGQRPSDGAILFGVYGTVEEPGVVQVGDVLEPL